MEEQRKKIRTEGLGRALMWGVILWVSVVGLLLGTLIAVVETWRWIS